MVGVTLAQLRARIEELAADDGTYAIVCGRTGDRPVPAARERFADREGARDALRATEQYRAALRRYDPQLPYYDLIVCEDVESPGTPGSPGDPVRTADGGSVFDRSVLGRSETMATPERRTPAEFCHRVAASVFETLSETGARAVETAVMDAYLDLAETVDDPADLCLCLLESMATELDTRLTFGEQADLLAGAAARLRPLAPTGNPLPATLSTLRTWGLLREYTQSPAAVDICGGTRSTVVRLSGYALSPREGRLPVLPIVLDLYRRRPDWLPSSIRAVDVDGGWRLTITLAEGAEPTGLTSVPIRSEVT